jgi:hypothetical protein
MARRTSALVAAAFGAALLLAATAAALADEPKAPLTEPQKIEALIKTVEGMKDAKFVRNGSEYDGPAAADHMRRKLKKVAGEVKTARDFVRLVGTKSETSGKPYTIRFKDGRETDSAKFLNEKLDEIEKGPVPAASFPAT